MAARELPNLGLEGGYEEHEDGWAAGMALNLLKLSVLVQGGVIDKVAAEPGAPALGDTYILDETHATHPNEIAVWDGEIGSEAWIYFEPLEGWLVFNRTANYYEKFDGTAWAELETGGGGGGGVPEAPEDSKLYGRKNAAWEEIIGGGGEGGVLPYAGARVRRSATTVLSTTGAWATVNWDVEDRDTSGLWAVGAPTRFTIPAGVTKIRLAAGFQIDSSDQPGSHQFSFRKNGSDFFNGRVVWNFGGGGYNNPGCFGVSDVVDVVAGDYFELIYFAAESFAITTSSFFAIELVERSATNAGLNLNLDEILDVNAPAPADGHSLIYNATTGEWEPGVPTVNIEEGMDYNRPFKGAMARLNADKASSNNGSVIWDGTDYDTDSFWSAANPVRLTVPAGVTKIRLAGCVNPASTELSGNQYLQFMKNGSSAWRGASRLGVSTGYTDVGLSISSPVISVVAGDYFELFFGSADTARTWQASRCFFSIEVIETETTP